MSLYIMARRGSTQRAVKSTRPQRKSSGHFCINIPSRGNSMCTKYSRRNIQPFRESYDMTEDHVAFVFQDSPFPEVPFQIYRVEGDEDVDVLLSCDISILDANMQRIGSRYDSDDFEEDCDSEQNDQTCDHIKWPDTTVPAPSVRSIEAPRLRLNTMLVSSLIREQEALYGTNMYTSLNDDDEAALSHYVKNCDMTMDEAVYEIFCRRNATHPANTIATYNAAKARSFHQCSPRVCNMV